MKAMVIERFGGPEVFVEREMNMPELQPGHVLVEVMATSVNAVDVLIRREAPPFLAPDFPAVLHADFAGIVVDAAPDVENFEPGDRVYGCAGGLPGMGGALAEYMLADASLIAKKPANLSMAEAAALPLVTLTAWEALVERTTAVEGKMVLVQGGAGGVGSVGIQLARAFGAEVYATVSSGRKGEIAKDLGAVPIDYTRTPVQEYVAEATSGKGFDIVFDTVGGANMVRSFEAARINGDVATTVALGECDLTLAHLRGLSLHVVFMLIPLLHRKGRDHHGRVLAEAARLAEKGLLRPLIDPRQFSFREVAEAHELMESGDHVGKIVLTRN